MADQIDILCEKIATLKREIAINTLNLETMKNTLLDLMADKDVRKVATKTGIIKVFTHKNNYLPNIKKEIYRQDKQYLEGLIQRGLLKLNYRLDPEKYTELKSQQEKTELDEFVMERKNKSYLIVTLTEPVKSFSDETSQEKPKQVTTNHSNGLEQDVWSNSKVNNSYYTK